MSLPKHQNPTLKDRVAVAAPYNFVPLPENMVEANVPLDHDRYHAEGHTGWIECTLKTCSPTYIRGMLTSEQLDKLGNKKSDQLNEKEKNELAPFFNVADVDKPIIPGSSLRGMIRTLVEVVGYGRTRWVADEPTFTFRAVAASSDDPLKKPYQDTMGSFGRNVRAGYLEQEGENWYIRPALTQITQGIQVTQGYIKVKERAIVEKSIVHYVPLHDNKYHPQWHEVSFDAQNRLDKRKKTYIAVTNISDRENGSRSKGVLVCSGNMLETNSSKKGKLNRKNHALILEANPNASRLLIKPTAIKAYQDGLTEYQRDKDMLGQYWAGGNLGCLKKGAPVFYIAEGKEVRYFGHSPNFRIPAYLHGTQKAATPLDFVPKRLYQSNKPDLADAMFGWVSESTQHGLQEARAGRVFFEDAHFVRAEQKLWGSPDIITPHPLANPKPTTFQHYLVQDRNNGHSPDSKQTLAHYGTSPEETQLRGYKFYWTKGDKPPIQATTSPDRAKESQLTRIRPVQPNVYFTFKIRFENLRAEELGVLLWSLTLPGEADKSYCHRIGMGKPLGLGAISLKSTLYLTERQKRYCQLFDDKGWFEAKQEPDMTPFITQFEQFILQANGVVNPENKRLNEVERIQMLLKLHEWHEGTPTWLETTRYMTIEPNEYTPRRVLPDPLHVGIPLPPIATTTASNIPPAQRTTSNQPVAAKTAPAQKTTSNHQPVAVKTQSSAPQVPYQSVTEETAPPPQISLVAERFIASQPIDSKVSIPWSEIPQEEDIFTGKVVSKNDLGDVIIRHPKNVLASLQIKIPFKLVGDKNYGIGEEVLCKVIAVTSHNGIPVVTCEPTISKSQQKKKKKK